MMSAKMATTGSLRITVFWNIEYDTIIFVDDVSNTISSLDSNCVADLLMWPKFGNPSISMKEVANLKDLIRKTACFEGWPWLKFNNLVLTLGTNLKFYTSLEKGLKLKVRTIWELIPTFVSYVCSSYSGKIGSGGLLYLSAFAIVRCSLKVFPLFLEQNSVPSTDQCWFESGLLSRRPPRCFLNGDALPYFQYV